MILKSAAPINDPEIIDFLRKLSGEKLFCHPFPSPAGEYKEKFTSQFILWLEMNDFILGSLESWTPLVSQGTTESFMDFHICHHERKTYVLQGEYPYHHMTGAQTVESFTEIPPHSKFIISLPFSATGNIHPEFYECLSHCELHDIKVLIDCALLPVSQIQSADLKPFSCIERICFSLSKSFASGRLRAGLSFLKSSENLSSPLKCLNEWSYLNHLSLNIHIELMKSFPRNFLWDKYRSIQKKICDTRGVEASNTLIFGLSKEQKYDEFSRQGFINRLCLSEELIAHHGDLL